MFSQSAVTKTFNKFMLFCCSLVCWSEVKHFGSLYNSRRTDSVERLLIAPQSVLSVDILLRSADVNR